MTPEQARDAFAPPAEPEVTLRASTMILLRALRAIVIGCIAASIILSIVAALTVWAHSGHDLYESMARVECVETPVPDVCLPPAGVPQRVAP